MSLQERAEGPTVEDQSRNIIRDLALSTAGVSTVAEAVVKSYTDLPTSEAAVGIKESEDLTAVREKMTQSLVLFRDLLLPLGDGVVNDLLETLDFFSVDDFDQFKALIPVVVEQVRDAEDRAKSVGHLYVKLGVDLEKLGKDAEKALKTAEVAAKAKLESVKAKEKAMKVAAAVAGVSVAAGVGGGLMLALGLLFPGGLLFSPALAPAAFVAGSAAGVAAGSVPAAVAGVANYQANQALKTHDMLEKSGVAYQTVFTVALSQFAVVTRGFADFFCIIGDQLVNVDKNLGRLNDEGRADGVLRALYNVVRGETRKLREACRGYVTHSTQVKIKIGVLDQFERECYRSYIDEWYKNCVSEREALASMRVRVQKVLHGRHLSAPH